MEKDDQAFAAALGGDERRAVGEARPDFGGEVGGGFGQDLAVDDDRCIEGKAGKGAGLGKGLQGLRRFPGQARCPSARPPSRKVTGISGSCAAAMRGPAKRKSRPPRSTQAAIMLLLVLRQHADIGERPASDKPGVELALEVGGLLGLG